MYVILDLDGPLLDVSGRHYEVYRSLVTDLGGTAIPVADYWAAKRTKVPESEIVCRTCSADILDTYTQQRKELLEQPEMLAHDALQPGAIDLLDQLKGTFKVICTLRTDEGSALAELDALGIKERVNTVLCSAEREDPRWKVKYRMLESIVAERSGETGYFIGDTETDMIAGRELGLVTYAVTNGIRSRELLEATKPDVIFEGIHQVRFNQV